MEIKDLVGLLEETSINPGHEIEFRPIREIPNFGGFLRKNKKNILKVIGKYEFESDYEKEEVLFSTYTLFDPLNLTPFDSWLGIPRYLARRINNSGLLSIFIHYNEGNLKVYFAKYKLREERKSIKRKKELEQNKLKKRIYSREVYF